MPIRFACTHCGQRLSVGSHKAGKTAACPKCKASITVPIPENAPPPAEPESPEIVPEPPPVEIPAALPGFVGDEPQRSFNFDRDIEVVYETRSAAAPARPARRRAEEDASIDLDRVALPRYVIYVQGGLLAVVGIVCFLLGMAVGGAVSESAGNTPDKIPIAVTGAVTITAEGIRTPDAGAVVIFFPHGSKPDEKGNLIGVRPEDEPAKGVQFRDYLRILGGGMAYCDAQGKYSVQLPDRGRYYLLAISSHASPSPGKIMPPQEVAQLGQYVHLADDPLEEFRYQWRLVTLRGSQQVNVTFD